MNEPKGNETMPDFNAMDRAELSVWYKQSVGYDLGSDDPDMTLEEYREICIEMWVLQNV